MRFEAGRLRAGEWVLGTASALLILSLFTFPWYGQTSVYAGVDRSLGVPIDATGFQSLTILRFVVLVAGLLGLVAWWLQATRPAPALPVCAVTATWGLACALFVVLIVRVLIDEPRVLEAGSGGVDTIGAKWGAYAALALTFALILGCYRSLRQDGIAPADAPQAIDTLRLVRTARGSRPPRARA